MISVHFQGKPFNITVIQVLMGSPPLFETWCPDSPSSWNFPDCAALIEAFHFSPSHLVSEEQFSP